MCPCCGWGRTNWKKTQDDLRISLVKERNFRSHQSNAAELEQVDVIDNDRLSWVKGVTVQVFSESNLDWFTAKIIEVADSPDGRIVTVVYDGITKSVPVFSKWLRPLPTEFSGDHIKSFKDVLKEATELLDEHKPGVEPTDLDAFISYTHADSQDAAAVLSLLLKSRGIKTWFDQQQVDLSVRAMSKGISRSCCFIIFLTKSYFKRKFTVFELETALALDKTVIMVWEGDDRYGGFRDFKSYMKACPQKYKLKLFEQEALKFERRRQLQEAQMNIITDRISQAQKNQVRANDGRRSKYI